MKILDLTAGRRAVWFNKSHPDALYIDIRTEVAPDICADATNLPPEIVGPFDLIIFDPPHVNSSATGNMSRDYGHWTAAQIRGLVRQGAQEAYRVSSPNAVMSFKWNDHDQKLSTVLELMAPWWEPLVGHGINAPQRRRSMTSWVLLRRMAEPAAEREVA